MLRELKYLSDNGDVRLGAIRRHNWTDAKLSVLFALNSVYQEILGPLDASAREDQAGLGTNHPILHGSQRFDRASSRSIHTGVRDFMTLVAELGFVPDWLTKNTCGDLIFYIDRHESHPTNGESDHD